MKQRKALRPPIWEEDSREGNAIQKGGDFTNPESGRENSRG